MRSAIDSQSGGDGVLVLLLILESFGRSASVDFYHSAEYKLEALYRNISRHANIKVRRFSSIPSKGSTVSTELEYLCDLSVDSYRKLLFYKVDSPVAKDSSFLEKCIPRLLAKKGFDSFYFHAGNLDFLGRKYIHPLVGFDELKTAFTFSCDKDIALFCVGDWFDILMQCAQFPFCAPPDSTVYSLAISEINNSASDNLFGVLTTIDTHGPYRSAWLGKSDVYIYNQKVDNAVSGLSKFLIKLRNSVGSRELKVFLASDHPPALSVDIKCDTPCERFNFLHEISFD